MYDITDVRNACTVVVSCIMISHTFLKRLLYFSDGAASQYKNFKNLTNLCHHHIDHGLDAEWHFFSTSHGKSPCDSIGGTVKCLVARSSLQATIDGHILTASQI